MSGHREFKQVSSRKWVRADQLIVDSRVQGELHPARVRDIQTNLHLGSIGVLEVSRRKDGALHVMDGQHRLMALRAVGLGDMQVQVNIHDGLSEEEEAARYRRHNNTHRVAPWDDFRVALVEQDPDVVAINSIVEAAGFQMSKRVGDGHIVAVGALRHVFKHANGDGPQVLEGTLMVVDAAWGKRAEAVDGKIIQGLAAIIGTYNGEIDRMALAKKLAKYPGGPSGLLGKARVLKEIRRTSVIKAVAEIALDVYNSGRTHRIGSAG